MKDKLIYIANQLFMLRIGKFIFKIEFIKEECDGINIKLEEGKYKIIPVDENIGEK